MITDIPEELAKVPWVKPLGNHQENYAVILEKEESVTVVFYAADSGYWGVFDEMDFNSKEEAMHALDRNGFFQCSLDPELERYRPPLDRFQEVPDRRIYSSGEYWT